MHQDCLLGLPNLHFTGHHEFFPGCTAVKVWS